MNRLRSRLVQMSPKSKQICVVVGAAAALFFVIWLFQGEPEKRVVYDKKKDQVANVLTDRSNRNVGLDRMAGQIRRLDKQNEEVVRDLNSLKASLEDLKKDRTLLEMRKQIEALSGQFAGLETEQRRAVEALDEASKKYSSEASDKKSTAHEKADRESKGDRSSISDRLRANREKHAGERVKSDGTIEGNPFAYDTTTAAAGDRPGSSTRAQSAPKKAPLRISVVSESRKEEPAPTTKAKTAPEDAVAYIPAGSIITGTIITGGDFPTGRGSYENPTPTLIRIQKEAILPNKFTSDIRECFLLVGGRGELSSERAKLRGEVLSCVRRDGAVIETKLNSYVVGEDGKEGVKGRLVSKQGQMIARTLVAGFASGMAEAFDYDAVPVIQTDSISNNTLYQQNWSSDAAKGGLAKGASAALERVADFYMDLAEQMVPVVEINAGRQVDVVVINGTRLKVTTEPIVKPAAAK